MANKPTVDASDGTLENNRKSRIGREEKEDRGVILKLLESREGRAWLWRKLESANVFDEPFVSGEPDTTAFRCGRQNMGRELLAEIQRASPRLYMVMTQEAYEVDQAEQIHILEREEIRKGAANPEFTADDQWPHVEAPKGPGAPKTDVAPSVKPDVPPMSGIE